MTITMVSFLIIGFLLGLIISALLLKKYSKNSEANNINFEPLNELFNPLKDQLNDFQKTFNETFTQHTIQGGNLKEQIEKLTLSTDRYDQRAKDLTAAFTGSNKIQGMWGERVLEVLLENSALREGHEYYREKLNDDNGRPDVIVKIPDDGIVVIDSKLSFKSYKDFVNEKVDEVKKLHLKKLVKSTEDHIKKLASKNYWHTKEYQTPEFVLMFFPIDNLFHLVIDKKSEIYDLAYANNVMLVSPSTLLPALKTISSLWKNIRLADEAMKISEKSGEIYDKLDEFSDKLIDVQSRLFNTYKANTEALKILMNGKKGEESILKIAESFKSMGANTTSNIDYQKLEREIDRADEQIEKQVSSNN